MKETKELMDYLEVNRDGFFDLYKLNKLDCDTQSFFKKIFAEKEKEENPKPFIEQIDIVDNCVGGGNARVWIPLEGNVHSVIAIPHHLFRDQLAIEFFPIMGSFAVRDIMNKYAPGKYIKKFPNDIVCREHGAKTSGMLFRKVKNFSLLIFAVNFVKVPDDSQLRKQGLRACCLKNHTDNIPPISQFLNEVGLRALELCNKEFTTIEKIVDTMNESYGNFEKKQFKVVINNKDADLLKDGVMWGKAYPNALIRGYLNGHDFEYSPTLYDTMFFNSKGETDESREFEKVIERQQENANK